MHSCVPPHQAGTLPTDVHLHSLGCIESEARRYLDEKKHQSIAKDLVKRITN